MTVEEICRLLGTGWVDARDVPELENDELKAEIHRRAQAVGQRLFYSPATDSYGFVLDGEVPEAGTHRPALRLDRSHRALIAACWMHLRWLPAERARAEGVNGNRQRAQEEPSLTVDDLSLQFKGQLQKTHIEQKLLPYLKRLGYLNQREGRLFAGPMLDSLDELKATERAREYMIKFKRLAHLQRRAQEIDQLKRAAQEAQRC